MKVLKHDVGMKIIISRINTYELLGYVSYIRMK